MARTLPAYARGGAQSAVRGVELGAAAEAGGHQTCGAGAAAKTAQRGVRDLVEGFQAEHGDFAFGKMLVGGLL